MLQDLYVIKNTGECLYHKSFTENTFDPAIVSSFLSAISMFSENLNEEAHLLETRSFRFVYHSLGELILVARVSRETPVHLVEEKLEQIAQSLKKRIKFDSRSFDGSVTEFNKLDREVETRAKETLETEKLKLEVNPRVRTWVGRNDVEQKVFSYVRFKGKASLKEIVRLMRLPEMEAWKAAQTLLSMNVLRRIEPEVSESSNHGISKLYEN